MEPDFSGWATKYNKKCSDGLTILPGSFQHDDKITLPLVWRHDDSQPSNILGHVKLTHKDDGVWVDGFFNKSKGADESRVLLEHGDIKSMSIHAREVVKRGKDVIHGAIKEVSLVTAGANPGAVIENVYFKHGDITEELQDEIIIHSGEEIQTSKKENSTVGDLNHDDNKPDDKSDDKNSGSSSGKTVKDVYDAFSEEQKNVVHYLIGEAVGGDDDDDDDDSTTQNDNSSSLNHGGTEIMHRNVFDNDKDIKHGDVLTHSDLDGDTTKQIIHDMSSVGSARNFLTHAEGAYGVQNLELLFPDARTLAAMPEFIKRRTEWVAGVLSGVRSTPFTRVKSVHADLTADEARARGYIKSTQKVEEIFPIMVRTTGPKTIYKKQRLDRDDILDVTDFDLVVWIKAEMRLQLEEELARAILIGDGRPVDSPDKIRDPAGAASGDGIRSILKDSDFYADKQQLDVTLVGLPLVEHIVMQRREMRGSSGRPTMYTTHENKYSMLFSKDADGRRYFSTEEQLVSHLGVSSIVVVDPFEEVEGLHSIVVNLSDYSLGTDKGGKTAFFDDFDIDFNQYKYLYETRLSGALTKFKSAQVFSTVASVAGNLPAIGGTAPSGDQSETTLNTGYAAGETTARARGYKGQPTT